VSGLLEAQVSAAGLAGLPGMTPVRLAKLLDGFHPSLAWKAVQAGAHPADPRRRFTGPSRTTDLKEVGERYRRAGVKILLSDMADYPSMLFGDPGAPAVLFALGDPAVLEAKASVAIVGTRSATHYGRQVASELARDLAIEGVVVVSGLARGIDGAAHAGALRAGGGDSAPPIAVVGTGLDVVYPPSNRELWAQVAERGVILSESALGTKPHPGVFPARNRIIAALSDVVVVVESHRGGGSLYTAEAAARRSIPVCAVPGSVRSRASDGTNALLVDGCAPVRDATDVLVALSLATAGIGVSDPEARPTRINLESTRSQRSANRPQTQLSTADPPGTVSTGEPSDAANIGPATNTADSAFTGDTTNTEATVAARSPIASSGLSSTPSNPDEWAVLDAIDDVPTRFETILLRTGLSIASAAEACDGLVEKGLIVAGAGWWSQTRDLPTLANR
jgi:DNA processing protein